MPANSTQNMTDSQTQAEGTRHHSEPESAYIGRNALILAMTGASQPDSLPSHDVQPCIIMPYADYIGACYISMDSLCTLYNAYHRTHQELRRKVEMAGHNIINPSPRTNTNLAESDHPILIGPSQTLPAPAQTTKAPQRQRKRVKVAVSHRNIFTVTSRTVRKCR